MYFHFYCVYLSNAWGIRELERYSWNDVPPLTTNSRPLERRLELQQVKFRVFVITILVLGNIRRFSASNGIPLLVIATTGRLMCCKVLVMLT